MVKKMFVSSLQRTKAHDEPASPLILSARFQNQKRELSAKCYDFEEPVWSAAFEKRNSCFSRQTFQRMINGAKACRFCNEVSSAVSDPVSVTKSFKVDDRVSWNSEAGRVSGTIIRVHTRNFDVEGYTHHASMNAPQYEIKSAKTDHIAFHKGSALNKLHD